MINSGPMDSLSQLEGIIQRAPKLRKLEWHVHKYGFMPFFRFMYLLTGLEKYATIFHPQGHHRSVRLDPCGSPSWPDLKWISFFGQRRASNDEFQAILEKVDHL